MGTDRQILIVDDDNGDIALFCEAMAEIDPGAVCHVANDCGEALEKLRDGSDVAPDLVFLDLNMPGMDGRACLRELKGDERSRDIPIIVYTTSSHVRDRVETLMLGAAYFLNKANSFPKMRKGIAEAIDTVTSG
jgi:CheY-like chemotaxis protein